METIPDEKFIRIRIWQSFNDYFRQGKEMEVTNDMRDLNTKNLTTLLKLLDESDQSELLLKAQILRNLGWFEESKQIMDRINNGDIERIKDKLRTEIKKQNKQVFRLY